MRPFLLALATFATLATGSPAAEPSDILKYVPRQAEFVTVVDRPRDLVNAVSGIEPLRQLLAFDSVKEQLNSTNARRLQQLLAHFETTLGRQWPDLLDDIAGGGAAFAMRFEPQPPPAMLVLKAKNEDTLRRAFDMMMEIAKSELERKESSTRIESHTYRGYQGYKIGDDTYVAICGPVLYLSNKAEAVKLGVDLYINGAGESIARNGKADAARALLTGRPIAWTYLDLERIHSLSESKEAYRYPKGDPGQLFFQGITDVAGKSPYVVFGHYVSNDKANTTIRMAAGRDATPAGLGLHLPPDGKPGSLPLLEPKNVLVTSSYYFDLGKLWTEREKLFDKKISEELEKGEKKIGRFLAGRTLSEMLTWSGPYHRFVVVTPGESGYTIKPKQKQPSFAFVTDMRDPKFGDGMNGILRSVALFAGFQAKLKLSEETIGNTKLVCYRFPEKEKVPGDVNNNRFNFSPCFAKVGNQFMAASTVELGRELVGLLSKPEMTEPANGSAKTWRMQIDSIGGAELVKVFEGQSITQTILNDGISTDQARKEVAMFIDWLKSLGKLEFNIEYGPNDFKYDIGLRWKGKE